MHSGLLAPKDGQDQCHHQQQDRGQQRRMHAVHERSVEGAIEVEPRAQEYLEGDVPRDGDGRDEQSHGETAHHPDVGHGPEQPGTDPVGLRRGIGHHGAYIGREEGA